MNIAELAETFIKFHNAASKEYTEAFREIGTKMWYDDEAHLLTLDNQRYIAHEMTNLKKSEIFSIYKITRPSTRIDSYPNVTKEQRYRLNKRVDAIYDKYTHLWKKALFMMK